MIQHIDKANQTASQGKINLPGEGETQPQLCEQGLDEVVGCLTLV
jgi:hypothetical protein